MAEEKRPDFLSAAIRDRLSSGGGKLLAFLDAEPEVFNRIDGIPIGSKKTAVVFNAFWGNGTIGRSMMD
jgi:hypothetical protein